MALASTTGNPPAVTHDQVEAWNKLADDVTAALTMGGQQGLDLLLNIMAEWCEAVDDVNTARRICEELAERGLRQEAIEWHAKGFFEVADRLDPIRPGWGPWEETLHARDVITPHIDAELKELTDVIFEDLQLQDISGQTLFDWIGRLRRNILLRGHLGERATILESIISLDPAGKAWQDMIAPIRGKRAQSIAEELKVAVAARDFFKIAALRAEVDAHNGRVPLPGNVAAILAGTACLDSVREYRSQLSQAAASLVGFFEQARSRPPESPATLAAVQAASNARERYSVIRGAFGEALRSACSTPEVTAMVDETGARTALTQLDAAIRDACAWLEQQAVMAQHRAFIHDVETGVLRVLESVPKKSNDLEFLREQLAKWRQKKANVLENARNAVARLPGGMPPSVDAAMKRVAAAEKDLASHVQHLRRREKVLVAWVLGGVGLVFLAIIAIVAAAVSK